MKGAPARLLLRAARRLRASLRTHLQHARTNSFVRVLNLSVESRTIRRLQICATETGRLATTRERMPGSRVARRTRAGFCELTSAHEGEHVAGSQSRARKRAGL